MSTMNQHDATQILEREFANEIGLEEAFTLIAHGHGYSVAEVNDLLGCDCPYALVGFLYCEEVD